MVVSILVAQKKVLPSYEKHAFNLKFSPVLGLLLILSSGNLATVTKVQSIVRLLFL